MEIIDFLASRGDLIAIFFVFLFSLCFHEYAHGWIARRKGDRTAELMGRLTLNPLAHIDWVGTVVLPLFALFTRIPFFGWAKPVPVNERNLARPKEDMFWIAFAGPLSNVLLALIGSLILIVVEAFGYRWPVGSALREITRTFILVNLFLGAFNMIPLHPLDGAKVLARFLPTRWNLAMENMQQYTFIILILIFVSGAFNYFAYPVILASNYLYSWAFGLGALLNS
jgi:Zn-dependent protease